MLVKYIKYTISLELTPIDVLDQKIETPDPTPVIETSSIEI